ncbi:MAG: hypothetical protein M1453_00300 [Acidobacteria bacterium]|nr:hypothetical protein [Acidobacteriota bacterium]MCL5286428.1 hypothetical protein [Acidobacteriota bacterium]
MEQPSKSVLASGARLVLRSWRLLSFAYAVNLLLGILAALPVAASISEILNNSLEAERLVKGFDLGAFFGLLMHPEFTLSKFVPSSAFVAPVYLVFMLFVTGGLLADFREQQRITFGKFLESCAAFFWRFVRLLLVMVLALVLVGMLYGLLEYGTNKWAENSPRDSVDFWQTVGCLAFAALLYFVIRLWFDVAQIRAVAENEPKIRRALGRSFRMTFGNIFSLFWIFLRIGIVALAVSAVVFWFFVKVVRPEQVSLSILLGQVFVIFWLAMRFWLRACETVWYQRKFPVPVVFAEAPAPPVALESEPPPVPAPPLATPPDDASS